MSVQKKVARRVERRARRTRAKIQNTSSSVRVSVFRSLNHIYAQVIDDSVQKTLVSFSSLDLKSCPGDKKSVAKEVGIKLAQKAKEKGITTVVFDRGSFLYHGRVKALAEGLREGGLTV